jgi:K+:H+ antiporter
VSAPVLLLDFAIVLIAAEIGGTAFRLLRMPRAVGMLAAGIVLGPFTPGFVVDPAAIADLALLGAVFLMFSVGLSFDIRTFRRLGAGPFLLAGLGVGLSFVLGLGLGIAAGWSLLSSLFVGLILTSTSSTLGLKFLADFGLTAHSGAELVTAAILVDDILALCLMTLVVGVAAPGGASILALLAGLGIILALAWFLLWLGRNTVPRLLQLTNRVSPSSTVMIAVSFALLLSFGFAALSLPPLVGAFFAGSIVASTEYGSRVTRHMAPVTAIFMGVFFTSIGLLINPALIPAILPVALAAIGLAVVAKLLPGFFVLRRLARASPSQAWRTSTVLVPRAEIALIIAQYGLTIGSSPELLPLSMSVMIGTALLPPVLARAAASSVFAGRPSTMSDAAATVTKDPPLPP